MDVSKAIKERHSVRNFKKTKPVDYRKIIEIVEAGTKAPLAGNIYALKYIIVSNKEKIKKLAEASQQDFIADVGNLIVVCLEKKNLQANYYERGIMYGKQQAGASIENMLLKITEMGLSGCWIGAYSDQMVRSILKIPDNIEVEAMLPIGFELGKTKQQVKPDLDRVLFFDEWKNKVMEPKKIIPSTEV